jgi:hypothetical protein
MKYDNWMYCEKCVDEMAAETEARMGQAELTAQTVMPHLAGIPTAHI